MCIGQSSSGFVLTDYEYHIVADTLCKKFSTSWFVALKDEKFIYISKPFFSYWKSIDSQLVKLRGKYPDFATLIDSAKIEIIRLKESEKKRRMEQDKIDAEVQRIEAIAQKKELDSLLKALENQLSIFRAKNIVIKNWSWNYPNEYSSFIDFSVSVLNPFKGKIKYIWFTLSAYNEVDDPIREGFTDKTEVTVKGIGPIEYSGTASYNFESVFYSKVVSYLKLKQIKIQFFDGTTKIISKPVSLNIESD